MKKLSIEWFTGLPPERKEDFEKLVRNSTILLRQLNVILDKWEDELNSAESKSADYDTPSWSHKQADRNGDRRRIRRMRELLSFGDINDR